MANPDDMTALAAKLDALGDRIDRAQQALAQHGVGGVGLDQELERMRTAQNALKGRITGGDAHATAAADVENLRNAFERWIASNDHRFSATGSRPQRQ